MTICLMGVLTRILPGVPPPGPELPIGFTRPPPPPVPTPWHLPSSPAYLLAGRGVLTKMLPRVSPLDPKLLLGPTPSAPYSEPNTWPRLMASPPYSPCPLIKRGIPDFFDRGSDRGAEIPIGPKQGCPVSCSVASVDTRISYMRRWDLMDSNSSSHNIPTFYALSPISSLLWLPHTLRLLLPSSSHCICIIFSYTASPLLNTTLSRILQNPPSMPTSRTSKRLALPNAYLA